MKKIKRILLLIAVLFSLVSCNSNAKKESTDEVAVYQCPMKCEGDKTFDHSGSCAVCKMDLALVSSPEKKTLGVGEISDESIFNLTSEWHTEENEVIQLKDLKGKTLVMVMIYTSCKAACPRLVADMRNIEAQIPSEKLKKLQFVLVSIDPEKDTPEHLKAFAIENFIDGPHWTFLQGSKNTVREFANVLAVKYKQISPIDFSHSNIISVFNSEGELVHQQEGLGVDNKETIETILQITN